MQKSLTGKQNGFEQSRVPGKILFHRRRLSPDMETVASERDWDSQLEALTVPFADRLSVECDVSIQTLHPDLNLTAKQMMVVKALEPFGDSS